MHESTLAAEATIGTAKASAVASASGSTHTVRTEALCTWYGKTKVLDEVDLEIAGRQITALVGPSGCGKSTFLRCVNRMNDLVRGFRHEGHIRLDDEDIYDSAMDVTSLRRRVGMVFQHPNPFPMSIRDNILLAVREHRGRIPRAEAEGILEHSLRRAYLFEEIKDSLDRSALSLSGGQQQRLCIARALAVMPDLLMLDEPCASLDPISTARIEELLIELKHDYTIVIVTHNLAQAARISDSLAFFYLGKLIESGRTADVTQKPVHSETADYLAGAFG